VFRDASDRSSYLVGWALSKTEISSVKDESDCRLNLSGNTFSGRNVLPVGFAADASSHHSLRRSRFGEGIHILGTLHFDNPGGPVSGFYEEVWEVVANVARGLDVLDVEELVAYLVLDYDATFCALCSRKVAKSNSSSLSHTILSKMDLAEKK